MIYLHRKQADSDQMFQKRIYILKFSFEFANLCQVLSLMFLNQLVTFNKDG